MPSASATARRVLTPPTIPPRPSRSIPEIVAWVTPARAVANRTQGVGVRFPSDEKSRLLKVKIEEILGGHLASERPTQTI